MTRPPASGPVPLTRGLTQVLAAGTWSEADSAVVSAEAVALRALADWLPGHVDVCPPLSHLAVEQAGPRLLVVAELDGPMSVGPLARLSLGTGQPLAWQAWDGLTWQLSVRIPLSTRVELLVRTQTRSLPQELRREVAPPAPAGSGPARPRLAVAR